MMNYFDYLRKLLKHRDAILGIVLTAIVTLLFAIAHDDDFKKLHEKHYTTAQLMAHGKSPIEDIERDFFNFD